jgi:hypothetical protein
MTQPSGIQPNLFPQAFSQALPEVVQTRHHAPHLSSRYGHINSADVRMGETARDAYQEGCARGGRSHKDASG